MLSLMPPFVDTFFVFGFPPLPLHFSRPPSTFILLFLIDKSPRVKGLVKMDLTQQKEKETA